MLRLLGFFWDFFSEIYKTPWGFSHVFSNQFLAHFLAQKW
jgi:hypothetical protein